MKVSKSKYAVAVAMIFLLAGMSAASSPDPRDVAFTSIKIAYGAGKWEQVVREVEAFRAKWPRTDRESSLMVINAEANLRLRRIEPAVVEASRMIVQFPESGLIGRAHFLLGDAAFIRGQWDEAKQQLGWVVGFSSDSALVASARERLDELQGFEEASAQNLQSAPLADSTKIVLLLPSTGTEHEDAGRFLRGFLAPWRAAGRPDPLVFDTQSDPVRAVQLYRKASKEDGAWCAVGGLTTDEATPLATASANLKASFLTTLCAADGLASLSPNAIQGCPDYSRVGSELARYAMEDLKLRRFAVIAPSEWMNGRIASQFKESVAAAGGEILTEASFYPGSIDFTAQFKAVREVVLRRSFDDSLRTAFMANDSLSFDDMPFAPSGKQLQPIEQPSLVGGGGVGKVTLSKVFLDSLWEDGHRRARRWMESSGRDIDSALIPTPSLDAVLMLIEPGTIEMVAPQLARYSLNKQILGNEAWGDRDALRKTSRYIEGLIFANSFGTEKNDSTVSPLLIQMLGKEDKVLTKAHLAGERAARMLLAASKSAPDPQRLRDNLATLSDLPTLSGPVTLLREERVARDVPLFKVEAGEAKLIVK